MTALGKDRGYCFRLRDGDTASKWFLQDVARKLLPHERGLQRCHRTRHKGGGGVKLWRGGRGAWFSGLMQCKSKWICPVCAAKIARASADELQKGIDYALRVGFGVLMVTLTFPHMRADVLPDLLGLFAKALRSLKSGRAYQKLLADFGLMGEVRALEVTHGDNGWHPHTHAIVFSRLRLSTVERFAFECRLYLLWRAACRRVGLDDPTFANGVHVRTAKEAADYVAKWGFAAEVTHSHIKQGKDKGRTPWQLLAASALGDRRAAWLFREFAACFKGRRQLFYSRGLRQRIGLGADEMTDQECLDLEPEEKTFVCEVSPDDWRLVVRYRARKTIIAAAAKEDGAALVAVILAALRHRAVEEYGTDGTFARRVYIDLINAGAFDVGRAA